MNEPAREGVALFIVMPNVPKSSERAATSVIARRELSLPRAAKGSVWAETQERDRSATHTASTEFAYAAEVTDVSR